MSGVGEVASLLTLIKAARVLATSTCEVVERLRKAPAELTALVAQILALESELELLNYTAQSAHQVLLCDDLKTKIFKALTDAREAVSDLNSICASAKGNESIYARLRWMHKERRFAEDALAKIRVAREKLNSYMQILTRLVGLCNSI